MNKIQAELRAFANPKKAQILQRFFKTGPGEYAEGDRFLGVAVPQTRRLVKKYANASEKNISQLIASRIHEERLAGLLILTHQYKRGSAETRKRIFSYYVRHRSAVNNWDLVDTTAEHIVGAELLNRSKALLFRWARSKNLWERRIAILSTFHYIRQGKFSTTLKIAKCLIQDKHDLIHKAVGWLLREVGKRDLRTEEDFLIQHAAVMPRTMLRYAIEKFSEAKRKKYLAMKRP